MKKVLLIDDDEVFLKTVSDSLSSAGYRVIKAKDGKEGLETTEQERPDLILLDIMMPNLSGINFLKILKDNKELNKIPVVVVSNLTGPNPMDKGLEFGASGYIIKSDESLKTITNTVSSIIGRA